MSVNFLMDSFEQVAPRWPFAIMRMFLGVMWLYEALRGTPWDLPAMIIGIFLLAGILTPVVSLGGVILTIIIFNQRASLYAWGDQSWVYWLVMLLHAVMIVTRSGRRFGADATAAKVHPDWPVW